MHLRWPQPARTCALQQSLPHPAGLGRDCGGRHHVGGRGLLIHQLQAIACGLYRVRAGVRVRVRVGVTVRVVYPKGIKVEEGVGALQPAVVTTQQLWVVMPERQQGSTMGVHTTAARGYAHHCSKRVPTWQQEGPASALGQPPSSTQGANTPCTQHCHGCNGAAL